MGGREYLLNLLEYAQKLFCKKRLPCWSLNKRIDHKQHLREDDDRGNRGNLPYCQCQIAKCYCVRMDYRWRKQSSSFLPWS